MVHEPGWKTKKKYITCGELVAEVRAMLTWIVKKWGLIESSCSEEDRLPVLCEHVRFLVFTEVNIKIASSGMLRRVVLVRIDVSEKRSASIIRVTGIGELGTFANG
jgi:hypothetical protein